MITAAALAWVLAGGAPPSPVPDAQAARAPRREMRLVMGTTAELWVDGAADPAGALDAAFAALDRVDLAASLWKPSELLALNDAGQGVVSALLFELLRQALDVAAATQGAFDPTVEPLLRARGEYGGGRRAPGARETRRLLQRVGHARVSLDPATRRVRLFDGARLDLGGIAKGYAADLALRALRDAGARRALVDLGTSTQCVHGDSLTLGLSNPSDPLQPGWGELTLRAGCVSSSGGAQRGAHILDPRSGEPARRVLAATVVARDGAEADALSTALFVLGPEHGLAVVARRGAQGLVMLRERGRSIVRASAGFAEQHLLEPASFVQVREERAP